MQNILAACFALQFNRDWIIEVMFAFGLARMESGMLS
jgi:hypothetical protein